MSDFERKYGGFVLFYVMVSMMLAISAIPFADAAPWWFIPVMTAPFVVFTVALIIVATVALFLAALEDYRRASNTGEKP